MSPLPHPTWRPSLARLALAAVLVALSAPVLQAQTKPATPKPVTPTPGSTKPAAGQPATMLVPIDPGGGGGGGGTPPTVSFDPGGGSTTAASMSVTITYCASMGLLDQSSRQVLLNGADVTASFSYSLASISGCSRAARSTGTIALVSGANTIASYVSDSYGNQGGGEATFTRQGVTLSLAPNTGDRITVAGCVADCFESTLGYSLPSYTSLGVERSVSLMYRSGRAHPMGKVSLDATNTGAPSGTRILFQLIRSDGSYVTWANGSTNLYFLATPYGTTRLAGEFDASAVATGRYVYTAVVAYLDPSGNKIAADTYASPSAIIVNGQNSPYGAGVEVVGLQHVYFDWGGSAVITDGTGSASYFASSCTPYGPNYGPCSFTAPAGDFSSFGTPYGGSGYQRKYPDGTVITFDASGNETAASDRFGTTTRYNYTTSTAGATVLSTILDPAGLTTAFGYRGPSEAPWINGGLGYICQYFGDNRCAWFGVNQSNNLWHLLDVDGVYYGFADYDGGHRLQHFLDRNGGHWNYAYHSANTAHLADMSAPTVDVQGGSTRPETLLREADGVALQAAQDGQATWGSPVAMYADARATVRDPGGHTTSYVLDRWNQPLIVTDPLSRTTTIVRDAIGRATLVQHFTGATDTYRYDGMNLVMSRPAGRDSTNYRWSTSYGSPSGYFLPITQLDSVWGPRQPWQGFVYSGTAIYQAKSRYAQNDPATFTTQFATDAYGRIVSATDPAGHVSRIFYNGKYGNPDSTVAGGGQYVKTIHDGFGRDSLHRMSGRSVTAYALNPPTQPIVDMTLYDRLNRVTASYDGVHARPVTFEYGPLFLTKVRDRMGQQFRRDVNAVGWITAQYDPADTLSWSRAMRTQYDADGNAVTSTNRRGQTISVQYDATHRMTARTTPTSADYFGYSGDGLRRAAWNSVATDSTFVRSDGWTDSVVTWLAGQRFRKQYLPDPFQRLDSVDVRMSGGSIQFAGRKYLYDPTQNVLRTVRFLGSYGATIVRNNEQAIGGINYLQQNVTFRSRALSYTTTHQLFKDNLQPLTAPNGNTTGYGGAFGYDSLGKMREALFNPDWAGMVESFAYRGSGELGDHLQAGMTGYCSYAQSFYGGCAGPIQCPAASIDYGYTCNPGEAPITNRPYDRATYAYDDASNRINDIRSARSYSANFPADPALYSLSATTSYGNEPGNRVGNITGSAPYGPSDLMAPFSGASITFERDLDGNVTRRSGPTTDTRFTWDALGRLSVVTVAATGATVNYEYDAAGRLVRRRTNGAIDRHFLWDNDDLMAELDGSAASRIGEYVYTSLDHPLALVRGSGSVTDVDYFVQGGRGNVDLLFGVPASPNMFGPAKTPAVIHFQTGYTDWGDARNITGAGFPNRLLFKGMMYEGDSTQLYYARNRWYSPQSGTFMSEDPLGIAGGINTYAFAGDDPINGSDPYGLSGFTGGKQDPPNFGLPMFIGNALRNLFGGSPIKPEIPDPMPVPVAAGTGPFGLVYVGQAVDGFKVAATDALGYWRMSYDGARGVNSVYPALMGGLAGLGTEPEATAIVLGAAIGYEERPFYRYIEPPFSDANGAWLTRGAGWKAPYGEDFAKAKDILQLPGNPTQVVRVKVPWYEPVRGPRRVSGNDQFGQGGGLEWKRGWSW